MISIAGWVRRGAFAQAILGGAAWTGASLYLFTGEGLMGRIQTLLLFAVLVLVPLALALAAAPDKDGRHPLVYRALILLHPFAASSVVASFFFPPGTSAAAFASPWALFTGLVALFGLTRLYRRGIAGARASELCIDAALIYIPVGALWLLASRSGRPPPGTSEPIVILTSVHFHYAFFVAPIVTGLMGRRLLAARPSLRPLFLRVAVGVIVGPPLIAVGINNSPRLEVIGVFLLALTLVTVAVLTLVVVVPSVKGALTRALLVASSLPVIAAMALACYFGFGEFTDQFTIDIPNMARLHGWLNAAFALFGLLAYASLERAESAATADTL